MHPHVEMLRELYSIGDFRLIDKYGADDMILYRADREPPVVGKAAVLAYERMTAAGDRAMNVEQIIANDYFGCVMGSITSRVGDHELFMPFCGLWRFVDGKVAEHWENAYDIDALLKFFAEVG